MAGYCNIFLGMSRREISAGCVVYRRSEDRVEVALIQPHERKAWALPKGLIEPGEPAEHAAQRETREEAGLSGTIITKIDTIKYSYVAKWEKPATRVFKIVTFYLLRFTEGDPSKHDCEVDRVEWFPIDKAISTASYSQEKAVLKKAKALIATNSEEHS
jgi:8-oxo-dGTP pyrophosphatase MutT (NUDIX family)